MNIAVTKDKAKKRDEENSNWLNVCTDGSKIDRGVGVAAVVYRDGVRKGMARLHLETVEEHTGHEAKLAGIILGIDLLHRGCCQGRHILLLLLQ